MAAMDYDVEDDSDEGPGDGRKLLMMDTGVLVGTIIATFFVTDSLMLSKMVLWQRCSCYSHGCRCC